MGTNTNLDRVFGYGFGSIYRLYIEKVERKERTRDELDEVLSWLTGYTPAQLAEVAGSEKTLKEFVDEAPEWNPRRSAITGVICGVRVEDIEDPTMQAIRYMDKVVDELARGKALEKIKRAV